MYQMRPPSNHKSALSELQNKSLSINRTMLLKSIQYQSGQGSTCDLTKFSQTREELGILPSP